MQLSTMAQRFRADCSGAIAMLFGLVLVPILLVVGMAIDYGMATSYQSTIQQTLDEAAIAGATILQTSDDVRSAVAAAERRFDATKPTRYPIELEVAVDRKRRLVIVGAKAKVPMTFMALAGYKNISVSGHSEAAAGGANHAKRRQGRLKRVAINAIQDSQIS